jgi:dimethylaniline monooxygenase (N-oxide forming)
MFMQKYFPNASRNLTLVVMKQLMKKYGALDPSWRLQEDVAPISLSLSAASDNILDLFRENKITSVHGISRFVGTDAIEFVDGTIIRDVDAVICCTGYRADFKLIPFMEMSTPKTDEQGNPYGGQPIARLYKNIFPPAHADSIAILAYSAYGKNNGFSFADVTSMAISNIWRGVSADLIPNREEMERSIDEHQAWIASRWYLDNRIDVSAVKQWEFQGFLHEAAGTGLENLGWGWKGWLFWLKDPKMSYLMNHGVETAHAFRYFETGKRSTWPGARDAIIHVNEVVKQLKKEK